MILFLSWFASLFDSDWYFFGDLPTCHDSHAVFPVGKLRTIGTSSAHDSVFPARRSHGHVCACRLSFVPEIGLIRLLVIAVLVLGYVVPSKSLTIPSLYFAPVLVSSDHGFN